MDGSGQAEQMHASSTRNWGADGGPIHRHQADRGAYVMLATPLRTLTDREGRRASRDSRHPHSSRYDMRRQLAPLLVAIATACGSDSSVAPNTQNDPNAPQATLEQALTELTLPVLAAAGGS